MSKPIQTVEELDAVLHWRRKHAQAMRAVDAGKDREAALQRRLTAADERADVLEGLLREFQEVAHGGFLDDDHVRRVRRNIDAALKPAMSPLPGAYPDRDRPAPVAVAYQYRQRPLWRKDDNSGWMPWQDCSQEAHADYTASPDLHDWQYETRTLYAGPNKH